MKKLPFEERTNSSWQIDIQKNYTRKTTSLIDGTIIQTKTLNKVAPEVVMIMPHLLL